MTNILAVSLDHREVYHTDGQNIAGCYLRLGCEVEQQRNWQVDKFLTFSSMVDKWSLLGSEILIF
jgi:hypothetical protein